MEKAASSQCVYISYIPGKSLDSIPFQTIAGQCGSTVYLRHRQVVQGLGGKWNPLLSQGFVFHIAFLCSFKQKKKYSSLANLMSYLQWTALCAQEHLLSCPLQQFMVVWSRGCSRDAAALLQWQPQQQMGLLSLTHSPSSVPQLARSRGKERKQLSVQLPMQPWLEQGKSD